MTDTKKPRLFLAKRDGAREGDRPAEEGADRGQAAREEGRRAGPVPVKPGTRAEGTPRREGAPVRRAGAPVRREGSAPGRGDGAAAPRGPGPSERNNNETRGPRASGAPRREGPGGAPRREGPGGAPRREGPGGAPRREGQGGAPRNEGFGSGPRRDGPGATRREGPGGAPRREGQGGAPRVGAFRSGTRREAPGGAPRRNALAGVREGNVEGGRDTGPVMRGSQPRMVTSRESVERQFVSHEDPCRVLTDCGACTLLDLDYRTQLQMKSQDFRALVASKGPAFARARVMDCTPSDARFAYRHTAKLVVSEKQDRFAREGEPQKRWITIGLYRPGTHQVVDIGPCPVQTPHINSVVAHLRKAIKTHDIPVYDERMRKGDLRYVVLRTARKNRSTLLTLVSARGDKPSVARFTALARELMERFSTTLQGVLLHVNDAPGNAIFLLDAGEPSRAAEKDMTLDAPPGASGAPDAVKRPGETILLTGKRHLDDELAGLSLRVGAESFFQVNPHVAERMYNRIVEVADPAPNENALDLYCGVGGITLLLAQRCRRAVGIEESTSSIDDARHNAEANKIPNVDFFQGRAEDTLGEVIARGVNPRYDLVTLNPSRRGCQPAVLEAVAGLAPRRIVYMSCFADTLLRDAALLAERGYKPVFFEPFDMFPGTAHMEILCVLDREGDSGPGGA